MGFRNFGVLSRVATSGSVERRGYSFASAMLTNSKGKIRTGIKLTAGVAAPIGLAASGTKRMMNAREQLSNAVFRGSSMPIEAGRIGNRVSSQPVSMTGMKFSFNRNK